MDTTTTTTAAAAPRRKIKHLVISGGGFYGICALGALRYLNGKGFWNVGDIESIYGTSVGAIIGVMICLRYNLETLEEYVLNKNWQDLLSFNFSSFVRAIDKQGIFQDSILLGLFEPLFAAKHIPLDISLHAFFEMTKIDLHIFAVDVYTFELVDLNHVSHPQCRVIDAVYASSAVPVVFSPLYLRPDRPDRLEVPETPPEPETPPREKETPPKKMCLVDGALMCNFPIEQCLLRDGVVADEILAMTKTTCPSSFEFDETSSFFEYFIFLLNRLFFFKPVVITTSTSEESIIAYHKIALPDPLTSISYVMQFAKSADERTALLQKGHECATHFYTATELPTGMERRRSCPP